jgi:hypothetical protein
VSLSRSKTKSSTVVRKYLHFRRLTYIQLYKARKGEKVMNRTMTSILLVLSCLFTGGVLAQGGREHAQPSTAKAAAPNSPEPEQSVTQEGQDRLQNILNKRKGLPQSAFKIGGTWTFTGDLLQTTCPENVEQRTVSHIFTMEQNEDVLYVTSGAGIEFFGDLGTDGEFALASSTNNSPVSPTCAQEATLLISGNVHHRRASFAIANDFIGDCPGTNTCEFVYEGAFTKVKAKESIN